MNLARAAILSVLLAWPLAAQEQDLRSHPEIRSAVDLLERWITARMEDRAIPGLAIAVVHGHETLWMRGFGFADRERQTPVQPSTIFRIASITKTFTATATMILRDEGKLRLDDPVVMYVPWFRLRSSLPEEPAITIRHLLLHTSGIPREAAFPYWTDHVFPTREQIIETLPLQEATYPPETRYKYSNLGIALLGEVVSSASGMPYEQFIQERLLDPLGMQRHQRLLDRRAPTETGHRLWPAHARWHTHSQSPHGVSRPRSSGEHLLQRRGYGPLRGISSE